MTKLLKIALLVSLSLVAAQVEDHRQESSNEREKLEKSSSFKKEKGRYVISEIPELPASIGKPGALDKDTWLILFYTPWCVYSQKSEPHFLTTVQALVDHNVTGVTVGKLDISKQTGLGNHFNIRSTPVISIYHKGFRFNYEGEVNSEDLTTFAVKIIKAKLTLLETREELEAAQAKHPVLFITVYDSEVDSDWHAAYTGISQQLAFRAEFFYTTNPNILETPPAKLPALLVLKEGTSYRYGGTVSHYQLSKWILSERFLTLPTADMKNLRQFVVTTDFRKLLMLVVDEDSSKRRISQKKAHEVMKKLANNRKYHKKFLLALTEGREVPEKLLRRPVESFPLLFSFDPRTSLYNIFRPGDKGYTESTITEFIDSVQASEIPQEGGHTFSDRVLHIYYLIITLLQAMLFHHPYLGGVVILSMMGVVIFYTVLCCRGSTPRDKLPRSARGKAARKAAIARRDNGTLRHRANPSSNSQEPSDPSESEEEADKDK